MAKKIITFISVLNPRGDTLPEEKNYYYPKGEEGTPLKGRQTNEAPLKYLLREYGPIEQILCLCTDEVLQPVRGRDGTELAPSTADYLEEKLLDFCEEEGLPHPQPMLTPITIKALEDNMEQALAGLLKEIQPKDEILIDTTGGPRDANFLTMLIMQALSYIGCTVQDPIYSYYASGENSKLRRLHEMRDLMDLTSAMEEFTTYGRVGLLDRLLRFDKNPTVRELRESLKAFSDALELSRYGGKVTDKGVDPKNAPGRLEGLLLRVNAALDSCAADEDLRPLLKELLPAFREKMAFKDEKITLPSIVNWCAENHMIQQGLTIYRENIVDYLSAEEILCINQDRSLQCDVALSNVFLRHYAECYRKGALPKPYLSNTRSEKQNNSLAEYLDSQLPKRRIYFMGAMELLVKNGETEAVSPLPQADMPEEYKPIDWAAWLITRCLFRNSGERRPEKESAQEMRALGHMELLPMLEDRELFQVNEPEDLEVWLRRNKDYLIRAMEAERLAPMAAILREALSGSAPWIEKEIQEWSLGKERADQQLRAVQTAVIKSSKNREPVSPTDLGLTLIDFVVLRLIRNKVNHADSTFIGDLRGSLGTLDLLNQVDNMKPDQVQQFLSRSAQRLDMLARQARVSRKYL